MFRPLAALTAALTIGISATAAADSIVYTDHGDVWAAAPDGTGAHRLTRDGGYRSPTQADDGTIVAARGRDFVVLDAAGRRLKTVASLFHSVPDGDFRAGGPWDPQISPDGRRLAYYVGVTTTSNLPGVPVTFLDVGEHTVWQDLTDPSVLAVTRDTTSPSWLADSQRALVWDQGGVISAQAFVAGFGQDYNDIGRWFRDSDARLPDDDVAHPLSAGELTRDGTHLALLRGGGAVGTHLAEGAGNHIAFYAVSGFETPPVQLHTALNDAAGGTFDRPSWAPDGRAVAWAEGDGIWTAAFTGSTAPAAAVTAPVRRIPGGQDPDWGPADHRVAVTPAPTPGPTATPSPIASVSVTGARISLRRPVVRTRVTAAGRLSVTLQRGAHVIGRGTRTARGAGSTTIRLRTTRRARSARGHRATLTVTLRAPGAPAATVRRQVRVV